MRRSLSLILLVACAAVAGRAHQSSTSACVGKPLATTHYVPNSSVAPPSTTIAVVLEVKSHPQVLADARRSGRLPTDMDRIFISYRRDDTSGIVHRLKDALGHYLGPPRVFLDTADLEYGEPFRPPCVRPSNRRR